MPVLHELDVTLYISTISEFLSFEVKLPITYIPSFKSTEVTSVLGLGIGVPILQLLAAFCTCARIAALSIGGCNSTRSEIDASINRKVFMLNNSIILVEN